MIKHFIAFLRHVRVGSSEDHEPTLTCLKKGKKGLNVFLFSGQGHGQGKKKGIRHIFFGIGRVRGYWLGG